MFFHYTALTKSCSTCRSPSVCLSVRQSVYPSVLLSVCPSLAVLLSVLYELIIKSRRFSIDSQVSYEDHMPHFTIYSYETAVDNTQRSTLELMTYEWHDSLCPQSSAVFSRFLTCILTCYPVSILISLRLNFSTVHNLSLPSYHAVTSSFSYHE